ncbi:MAG: HDIG domain-containing protein [Victivallales bacterium]|nr:HDIG domain-containing protein [Victivallales bacterium]
MKSNPSKSNPPPSASATTAVPGNGPHLSAPQERVLPSADEQRTDLDHQRVIRDIQVKTRACLNHAVRARLKNYRVAWRRYWPLAPLLLVVWLIGIFCLMPHHFQPAGSPAVATRLQVLADFQQRLDDCCKSPETVGMSSGLQVLLSDPSSRQALVDSWGSCLDNGVLPNEVPPSITEFTGAPPSALLVVEDGFWESGHLQSYFPPSMPPILSEAATLVAQDFCETQLHSELSGELYSLIAAIGQPSLNYSEKLTQEYFQLNPPTPLNFSIRAPLLGQSIRPHQIYHPNSTIWHSFTGSNLLHALRSRAFHVNALVLLAFLIVYGFIVYITRVDYATDLRRFVLLGLLLSLEFIVVYFCSNYIGSHYEVPLSLLLSCLPLALFPAIIVNLLHERLAIITATLMAMLLPLQLNLPSERFPLFYFTLLVSLSAVLCFRGINRRMEFLTRGLIFGLTLAGAEFLFLLSQPSSPDGKDFLVEVVFLLTSGLANGMLNGIFCILLISLLEVFFRLPTAFSLTEISNLDSPLMERLRQDAPGTYEHSIAVAALSVGGAHVIGANAKLAYAMALYHDIGKLYSPMHFTENLQSGETTPHSHHSPEDSCEYLREHARFGLRLARRYHLPSMLYPAILQHHGNTIMASFYNQACRLATEKGLPPPPPEQYRYDQDPPSSREVALIMLADSCEAATRSLTHCKRDSRGEARRLADAEASLREEHPETSQEEIAAMYEKILTNEEIAANADFRDQLTRRVKDVIQGKLSDGQFDQVDLTTRQLALLAENFVATLLDKNHSRIEYHK